MVNPYVSAYLPLVDFLADALGENTEVVLHDLTDYHQSIVAIRNGHISGRKVGSPITDLSINVLKMAATKKVSYLAGYQGMSQDGDLLKSSTYFIKDGSGEAVGMLCINSDYQCLLAARDQLSMLVEALQVPSQISGTAEGLGLSVQELVRSNLSRVCPDLERRVPTMQQRDKMDVVDKLNDIGTFLIKGAVGYVAEALRVSVPTIYRYLNQLKKEE